MCVLSDATLYTKQTMCFQTNTPMPILNEEHQHYCGHLVRGRKDTIDFKWAFYAQVNEHLAHQLLWNRLALNALCSTREREAATHTSHDATHFIFI